MRIRPSLILLLALASPIAAQPAGVVEAKDPGVASRYAYYISGGGHFYTGERGKAFALLGVSAVSFYQALSRMACQEVSDSFLGADTGCSKDNLLLWALGAVAPYIYGIVDAPKSAARMNTRNGVSSANSSLFVAPTGDGGMNVGLRFVVSNWRLQP